jgi:hypothetical protein
VETNVIMLHLLSIGISWRAQSLSLKVLMEVLRSSAKFKLPRYMYRIEVEWIRNPDSNLRTA